MQFIDFVGLYGRDHDISNITWNDYRWAVKTLDNWYTRPILLDELSARVITDHLCWLRSEGRSPDTLKSRRTKLLVLWRAAYRGGFTENQPDADRIRRIKVPPPNPKGFSEDQTRHLVSWCESNMRKRMRLIPVPAGDYLAALFAFLWDSGMRIGDAVSMEFAWLGRTVTWRQSKTSVWHCAEITPRTLALIDKIRKPERALIWPRPGKNRTALYRMIKRTVYLAGLDGTSKFVRRGGATNVFKAGGDPARYCGHVPGSRVAFRNYVSQEAQLRPVSPVGL